MKSFGNRSAFRFTAARVEKNGPNPALIRARFQWFLASSPCGHTGAGAFASGAASGYLRSFGDIGKVHIGASVAVGDGISSGAIRAGDTIGTIQIKDSLIGNDTQKVIITAAGISSNTAMGSLSIGGRVENALILSDLQGKRPILSGYSWKARRARRQAAIIGVPRRGNEVSELFSFPSFRKAEGISRLSGLHRKPDNLLGE